MIHCALRLRLISDKNILAVKIENTELLRITMRHRGVTVVKHSSPARDDMALQDTRPRQPLCRGLDDLQLGDDSLADAFHLGQAGNRGRNDAVEIPEDRQKKMGQWLDILSRDCPEQYEFQDLIIWHGRSSADQKSLPQSLAVIANIGRHSSMGHVTDRLHRLSVKQRQGGFGERRMF